MPRSSQDFYVVTGGPGSGKSTLLDQLERDGVACMGEAGRAIIQDQVGIDGQALPWRDRILFAELMLSWDMRSHHAAMTLAGAGPVVFDRGVPDIIGYLRLEGLDVPAHVLQAAQAVRYNARVFVAPPWPEIYRQDTERKQNEDTARRTYQAMVTVYRELGYTLVELPKASVEERVDVVRTIIG